jgi:hypothetical protein
VGGGGGVGVAVAVNESKRIKPQRTQRKEKAKTINLHFSVLSLLSVVNPIHLPGSVWTFHKTK